MSRWLDFRWQHVFGGHSGSFYGSRSLLKEELAKPENAFVKSLTFNHKALSDAGLIALTGKVAAKDADRLINLIASLFKTAAGMLAACCRCCCCCMKGRARGRH